jgi:hypothetical protein
MKNNSPIFKTPIDKNYFFGYYDKSPISSDKKKCLCLEVDFIDRMPEKGDTARIGYFDLELNDGIFHNLTRTKTFNWQQGCMLQWFGDKNTHIIYNDLVDGEFKAIVFNIVECQKNILSMAFYTLAPDSRFALCIDNERHYWVRRGYSYDGIVNHKKDRNIVKSDGIFFLNIENNKVEKIINICDLLKINPIASMKDGVHYLEHLMISPCGKRFSFFHRWKINDGGIYARMYTANIDGSDLFLLNDSGRMSHFCWRNKSQIFGWGGLPNIANTLRKYRNFAKYFIKPLLPTYKRLVTGNAIQGTSKISSMFTGDSYILFNDKSAKIEKVPLEILDRDGHPSFCPVNKNWLVTDTYPDENGTAKLILYNILTKEKIILDELKSIQCYDNTPNRCDLHPKWSLDGANISIDTMNDGVRSMYLYDVSNLIKL